MLSDDGGKAETESDDLKREDQRQAHCPDLREASDADGFKAWFHGRTNCAHCGSYGE